MKKIQQSVWFGAMWMAVLGSLALAGTLNSCATLNALSGLSRIQFKLNNVQSVQLAGINIANKHSVTDFSVMDGLNLLNAFNSGRFPLTFTLNVAAQNPNPATGTSALSALQITDFPWHLLINNHETIAGNIGAPIGIPAGGQTVTMPLQVSLDLKQFFANQSYNDIIGVALQLAGASGASQLQLLAQPTMSTPIGSLKYPGQITIVSTEFRS